MILILLLLLFERLYMLSRLGPTYSLESDDLSYVKAGITLYETKTLTMHGVVSAQIMPGMPALISLFVPFFGTGERLWLALKVLWCIMGTLAPWFLYLAIREWAPKYAALLPTLFFFTPDFAWQDNLILSETPFMMLTCLYLYGVFRMAKHRDWGSFVIVFLAAFCCLMLKAQAMFYFVAPIPYLALKKYPSTTLYLQSFIGLVLLALFIVPWSIRNYYHFEEWIPLTYGIGNPLLLGTYQGEGYPPDEAFDYNAQVTEPLMEKYAHLVDDEGKMSEKHLRFFYMKGDEARARLRMDYWWKHDRDSMLRSYFLLKPQKMLFETFYWDEVVPHTKDPIIFSRTVEFYLSMFALVVAIVCRKYVKEVLFVLLMYWIQIYMYAYAYVFDRYAQTLLPYRYIALGLGFAAFVYGIGRMVRRRRLKKSFGI